MSKSNEFSDTTLLVYEICKCKNAYFSQKRCTCSEHDTVCLAAGFCPKSRNVRAFYHLSQSWARCARCTYNPPHMIPMANVFMLVGEPTNKVAIAGAGGGGASTLTEKSFAS